MKSFKEEGPNSGFELIKRDLWGEQKNLIEIFINLVAVWFSM